VLYLHVIYYVYALGFVLCLYLIHHAYALRGCVVSLDYADAYVCVAHNSIYTSMSCWNTDRSRNRDVDVDRDRDRDRDRDKDSDRDR